MFPTLKPCRCYPGVGDLDASDDEDTVLLENPAYENLMRKCLKVHQFSHCLLCALVENAQQGSFA